MTPPLLQTDVFISYSSADEAIARFVYEHLAAEKVRAFLASTTLQTGQKWTPEVFAHMKAAKWVIFLASRSACSSPFVQQELGAAIAGNKTLIPIVWDMPARELPGWVAQYHALNLAGRTFSDLKDEVVGIAGRVKQSQREGLLLFGLILGGIAVFAK
jgi:TIR domain